MTGVFTDTSFYVAVFNARDALHQRAKVLAAGLTGTVVTTEFVLVEVANFFHRGAGRATFVQLVANLRTAAAVEIVPASAELVGRGLDLFADRPDKEWSLTDCISFVVMTDRKLIDALTADEHFEQAGFRGLLRYEPDAP